VATAAAPVAAILVTILFMREWTEAVRQQPDDGEPASASRG
jgi:hypothetical protein